MYSHFTDSELLRFVLNRGDLTPLENELVVRLDRALAEIDGAAVEGAATPTQGDLFEAGAMALIESEA